MTAPVEPLNAYRDRVNEVVATTEAATQALMDQWEGGSLSSETAILTVAAAINLAKSRAVALADRYLAYQIELTSGQPTPTVGLLPVDESDRLNDAVATIFDELTELPPSQGTGDSESASPGASAGDAIPTVSDAATRSERARNRLTRVVASEPWESAQNGTTEAMQQHPSVQGWIRELNPDACTLCRYFAAGGRVFPPDHPFRRHPSCQCSQRVVLVPVGSIKPVRERKRRAKAS